MYSLGSGALGYAVSQSFWLRHLRLLCLSPVLSAAFYDPNQKMGQELQYTQQLGSAGGSK